MTRFLLMWLVLAIVILAIEGYVILGRIDRQTTWVRQLLEVANDLLAAQPGKSAPRTEAPPQLVPKRWWGKLQASAAARERAIVDAAIGAFGAAVDQVLAPAPAADPDGEMAVKVALTADPLPDDTPTDVFAAVSSTGEVLLQTSVPAADVDKPRPKPRPTPGPETRPSALVIDEWHREVTVVMPAQPDDVDRQLARFGLRTADGRPSMPPARDAGEGSGGDDR